jgi:hypothetical protein
MYIFVYTNTKYLKVHISDLPVNLTLIIYIYLILKKQELIISLTLLWAFFSLIFYLHVFLNILFFHNGFSFYYLLNLYWVAENKNLIVSRAVNDTCVYHLGCR